MMRTVILTLAAAGLVGCGAAQSPESGARMAGVPASASLSVVDQWQARVITLSLAERIADQCYASGIALAPSPHSGAVHRATQEMLAAGVDQATLDAAYQGQDFNAMSAGVEAYLGARGVTSDNTDALCRLGVDEIAQGTEVGKALMRT